MSDALFGAIIGGLIASVVPTTALMLNWRKWKKETRLEYWKNERGRLEKLYTDTYKRLVKAIEDESYPIDMTSDIFVLMPQSVVNEYREWIRENDKSPERGKNKLLTISVEMKKSLAEIDDIIKQIVSK